MASRRHSDPLQDVGRGRIRSWSTRGSDKGRNVLRSTATVVLMSGLALLLLGASQSWRQYRAQVADRVELDASHADSSNPSDPKMVIREGDVLGALEIPHRGVRVSIRAGIDDEQLDVAAGHVPGTALPGEVGNSVIAAHRNTLFSGLAEVELGDELRLTSTRSSEPLRYRVVEMRVVEPRDLSVLEPSDERRLTLVTCYPFHWIGPAPKRYVVNAVAETGFGLESPQPAGFWSKPLSDAQRISIRW